MFVLCATNRPEALDPALTRPGRLDRLVRVPLPDAPARLTVLRSALRRCPLAADVDLAELAGALTDGLSGADLAEACRRAGMAAIRELVAAEEAAWAAAVAAEKVGCAGSAGSNAEVAPEPAPLRQRHLVAALAGMSRSVSDSESQRHAAIEQRLREGSLPAPEERRQRQQGGTAQQQQQVLAQLVRQAASGSVQRLQERVAQLEAALRAAGLEPPAADEE